MGKIHLIRHGTTEANQAKKYYGKTDLPLAMEGINTISNLAISGIYPKADGAYFYTTGLLRTEQTFFLIYGCKDHLEIPELREYNFGAFEMKTHEELVEEEAYQAWINDRDGLTNCPQGESTTEFHNRVKQGFSKILEDHSKAENHSRNSIIVCHGGVISFIMRSSFPTEERDMFQWIPDPGRGFTLHLEEGTPISYEEI